MEPVYKPFKDSFCHIGSSWDLGFSSYKYVCNFKSSAWLLPPFYELQNKLGPFRSRDKILSTFFQDLGKIRVGSWSLESPSFAHLWERGWVKSIVFLHSTFLQCLKGFSQWKRAQCKHIFKKNVQQSAQWCNNGYFSLKQYTYWRTSCLLGLSRGSQKAKISYLISCTVKEGINRVQVQYSIKLK